MYKQGLRRLCRSALRVKVKAEALRAGIRGDEQGIGLKFICMAL